MSYDSAGKQGRKVRARACPAIPLEWLTDGKHHTAAMENGVFVHVSESSEAGCVVHRPDILARVMGQIYYVPAASMADGTTQRG